MRRIPTEKNEENGKRKVCEGKDKMAQEDGK